MDRNNVLIGSGTMVWDGSGVGYTRGGMTIEPATEHYKVQSADQHPGVLRIAKVREDFVLRTELLESSLENLALAWDAEAAIDLSEAGRRKLAFGGSSQATEREVVIYGKAPSSDLSKERIYTFYKAVSIEWGAHALTRDGESVIPVTIGLVVDDTRAIGEQLFEIDDEE